MHFVMNLIPLIENNNSLLHLVDTEGGSETNILLLTMIKKKTDK